jgi:hypothetical protein
LVTAIESRVKWVVLAAAASCALLVPGTFWVNAAHAPSLIELFEKALGSWDGHWYASIADGGYWYQPGVQSPVAFFPLYPLLIRGLAQAGLNSWVAASLISWVSGVAGVLLFWRWAQKVAGEEAASRATLFLGLYPFAFFLYGVAYSDAVFLLLVVSAFLLLEEGRPGWAALVGALATATRPVAPAVVVGLLVRSLELRRKAGLPVRARDVLPVLAVSGLGAYMLFLELRFDDALAFAHVQAAPGWDQPPGLRTWLKLTWFEVMFPRVAPLVAVRLGGHALVTVGALALAWPTRRLLGWGYAAYVTVAVGLPALSSKDFQGLGRYVIGAFPLFLTLALLLGDRPRLRAGWVALSALLLAALAMAYGVGGYVA